MNLGDRPDDGEPETDTGPVRSNSFGTALKGLDERFHPFWGEVLSGVLDGHGDSRWLHAGRDPDAAVRDVVDDRVVH
ncbi:MAG TPA: hypothetical protein VFV00_15300, partial [Acidimicrobiales bacterium]|nr:hypothetical protein [Acidimicrobiales bacterium]